MPATNPPEKTNPTWENVRDHIQKNISRSESGCWEWTLPLNEGGYGRMWGDLSHRMAYMAYVGPIGKGLDVDHICRNRSCCNPSHLEPVTRKENLARGVGTLLQKEKAEAKTHCSKGHEFTEETVYIRPSDGARLCLTCKSSEGKAYAQANKGAINERKREWRKKWKDQGVRK